MMPDTKMVFLSCSPFPQVARNAALCLGVISVLTFYTETVVCPPIAPMVPGSRGATPRIVIFPYKVGNVFQCGSELLRQIEQYCVVHFDIDLNSYFADPGYQNILNQVAGRERGRRSGPSLSSPFIRSLSQPQAREKQKAIIKCCHVGCTHADAMLQNPIDSTDFYGLTVHIRKA